MSDAWEAEAPGFVPQPAANDGVTAGTLLRRAREAAGLHVAALAVSLKVPVRKLEALEDDRWDVLPDAVFVRALASSVCRSLKIDPQPILERLPQTTAPRLVRDDDGINTPFRAPGDGAPPSWLDHVTRPAYLAVFALLLGALVLIPLPTVQNDSQVAGTAANVAVEPATPAVQPPAAEPQAGQAVAAPPVAVEPATPPVANAAPAATVTTVSSAVPVPPAASPGAVPPAGAVTSAAPVPPAATGIVVFRTKGPSWVEVTDAKGVVALRRVLETGEAAGASGALPLQVTVGRVDHTEVQVRGKPYDLHPVSKDNVARFEVK